jgi:Holliday junction resolvase RusA-like endonuclease
MIPKDKDPVDSWNVTVYTAPVAKGRPRARRMGNFVRMYTPQKTVTFERAVESAALSALDIRVIDFPVRVDILAVFSRPKRLTRKKDPQGLLWKPTRPDSDNLRKAVLDGLACVLTDDALVVDGRTCKVYGAKGQEPMVKINIRRAPDLPEGVTADFGLVDFR